MKLLFSALLLIIYVGSIDLYNWYLTILPIRYCKIWFNVTMLFGVVSILIPFADDYLAQQIGYVLKATIITNYVLVILCHALILTDKGFDKLFYLLNGSILATTLIIFFSAWQHGYFKKQYENE